MQIKFETAAMTREGKRDKNGRSVSQIFGLGIGAGIALIPSDSQLQA